MLPLFSIIVPTVNRPETLLHTLRTLIEQPGNDYEIIVTDDAGHEENQAVVESLQHGGRIRYIRHEQRQGMRGNYEFSVGAARGDYVTILGDDDGFVKNALVHAREAVAATSADVIFWWPHLYWWPTALIPQKQWLFYINKSTKSYRNIDAFSLIEELYKPGSSHWLFEKLPSIYNGFVSRRLLDKLKNLTGVYFLDEVPDVYSGIANGLYAENAVFVDWPLTIRGISGKSFGVAFRNPQGKSLSDEFKSGMKTPMCEPELVDSTALAVHIASIKLRAIRKLQGRLSNYTISIPEIIHGILSEIQEGQGRKSELLADIQTLSQKYNINISNIDLDEICEILPKKQWGWHQDSIVVNCEYIGVANIYEASNLLAAILEQ